MIRNYPSGAAKKRKAKEEQEKISKLPKITGFFKSNNEDEKELVFAEENINKDVANTNKAIVAEAGKKEDLPLCEINNINILQEEKTTIHGNVSYSTDPALWEKIDSQLQSYWLNKGPQFCNNKNVDFIKSARIYEENERQVIRSFNKSYFQIKLHNNEIIDREWLLYSPSSGCVYYFVCRLFSTEQNKFSSYGFNDWKHSYRIIEHKQSKYHKQNLTIYYRRKNEFNRVDTNLVLQHKKEQEYWIKLLSRIVDVIKFLASRGLAFRGNDQRLGSVHNGNYLGLIELLSQYDPFLKEHINKYGNKGSGVTSYLSANICEKIIECLGKKVLSHIIDELKKSKYFTICVDSTPDVTHTDQLTFTVRYVTNQGPVERFLMFIPIERHGSEYLSKVIINFLEEHNIDIADCRGQSYNNAANMSGQYSGLQARIKQINPYAEYIPCVGHSLNLVGSRAAECVMPVVAYFSLVQKLYTFFSSSTHKWQTLVVALGPENKVVKSQSATRWSARADAVTALYKGYNNIMKALNDIALDDTQSNDAKFEATCLSKQMSKLDNLFLTVVWFEILTRMNNTNQNIQKEVMDLNNACFLLKSLDSYLLSFREQFFNFLEKAKNLVSNYEVPQERKKERSIKIKRFEGNSSETKFNFEGKLKIQIFYPIVDSLSNNLRKRTEAYTKINDNFTLFTELKGLDSDKIEKSCTNLANFYSKDISAETLKSECLHFKHYIFENKEINSNSIVDIYVHIREKLLFCTFPNIEICLRIFLSLMISNCSGERSLSKLKRIKSDTRSTMKQSRLNYLSIMSIESDLLQLIKFEDIIDDLSAKKVKKIV